MLDIPTTWLSAAEALRPGQTIAVVGDTDVGKSTFAEWLVRSLTPRGAVGLVDCDLGQTTLGPPTTVGGKVFDAQPESCDDLWPEAIAFVGSTSPRGHLLQTTAAAAQVCHALRDKQPTFLVIDTSGFVAGGAGRALKVNKLKVVRADTAVVIERAQELAGLAWALAAAGIDVVRLAASPAVANRSAEQRRTRRQEKFAAYFAKAKPLALDLGRVLGSEQACRIDCNLFTRALVSLDDASGRCLGLGVVEECDVSSGRAQVLTPVADDSAVRAMVVGSLRLAAHGSELAGDPRPAPR